jgi:hypothetical protein
MLVDQLLKSLREGGDEGYEAALALGLLIERARRGAGADVADIVAALPATFSDVTLTPDERDAATRGLARHVTDDPSPHAMAAWALSKSADATARRALLDVLKRNVEDPNQEHLAYQALVGVTPFRDAEVLDAVRVAATRGHGRVRETAAQYLAIAQ